MDDVLRTWADDAVRFARVLADQDASWGSKTWAWAGGHLVLCGPGMYVNRAMAAGWDRPPTPGEFGSLERWSAAIGVAPSIDVTPQTHAAVRGIAIGRGYEVVAETSAVQRSLADVTGDAAAKVSGDIEIAPGALHDFQEVSASAWGREAPAARRASDAYARAASASGDELLVARVAGRPVGCASLSIRPPVATLGAMATLPDERGRGIQSAMIRHRLQVAERAGCAIAVSSAAPDGSSERNLLRAGFEPWFTIVTVGRPPAREGR